MSKAQQVLDESLKQIRSSPKIDDILSRLNLAKEMLEIYKLTDKNVYHIDILSDTVKLLDIGVYFPTNAAIGPTGLIGNLYENTSTEDWMLILNNLAYKFNSNVVRWTGRGKYPEYVDFDKKIRDIMIFTNVLKDKVSKDVFDKIQKINAYFGVPTIPDAPNPPPIQ